VWRQADRWRVPRIAFANKMDRVGADFAATLASMRRHFPDHAIAPIHRPIGAEGAFQGLEDLVSRRRIRFPDPEDPKAMAVEEGLSPDAEADRAALVSVLADLDEVVADAVLADRDPDEATLRAAIRRVTVAGRFVPLLCGSALRNKGVPQVIDAVCDYLPSPLDVPPAAGVNLKTGEEEMHEADDHAPLLALAFKVSLLDEKRRHVFVRVYSGRIAEGDDVWNADLGKKEKVARVLLMHAVQKKRVPSLGAGHIFAVVGLKETRTGNTLSDPAHPLRLGGISPYEPVISQAIETTSLADRDLLLEALARVADEDPSFKFGEDSETGQLLVSGMGELHLEIVAERLRREFGLKVTTGQPQVLMRETLTAEAAGEGTFEREIDDEQVFGRVAVRVGPLPRGGGLHVGFAPDAAELPFLREETRHLIEEGAREAAEGGVLEGYTLQDVDVVITGAEWREGASKPFAYKVAAADAVRAAAARARPVLLEPIVRVEVVTPGESLGAVMNGLDARRGTILDVADRGQAVKLLECEAPLRRMFGYATELRSATQGRAVFTMRFDRFDVA
jgi:elongation factor G